MTVSRKAERDRSTQHRHHIRKARCNSQEPCLVAPRTTNADLEGERFRRAPSGMQHNMSRDGFSFSTVRRPQVGCTRGVLGWYTVSMCNSNAPLQATRSFQYHGEMWREGSWKLLVATRCTKVVVMEPGHRGLHTVALFEAHALRDGQARDRFLEDSPRSSESVTAGHRPSTAGRSHMTSSTATLLPARPFRRHAAGRGRSECFLKSLTKPPFLASNQTVFLREGLQDA